MTRFIAALAALAFLAAVGLGMLTWPAKAQDDVYRAMAETNSSIQVSFVTGSLTASSVTLPAYTAAVRLVCDAACMLITSATTAPAITAVSGLLLPANVPLTLLAGGNEYVVVIGVNASGILYVQALTK